MPRSKSVLKSLKILKAKWAGYLSLGLVIIVAVAWITRRETFSTLWLFLAAFVFLYQAITFHSDLHRNHAKNSRKLLPYYGFGTWLSLIRLLALSLLAGFIVLPRPTGRLAWAPFVLYLAFNLLDLVDGYVARRSRQATVMGGKLDLDLDGRGMLLGSLLAVLMGTAGWWYVLVGLARYVWILALWLRQKQGMPIHARPNPNSRPLAGLQMGITTALLAPVLFPPFTILISTLVMIPFLANFVFDWMRLDRQVNKHTNKQGRVNLAPLSAISIFPLLLRVCALGLLITLIYSRDVAHAPMIMELIIGLGFLLGFGARLLALILLAQIGLTLGSQSPCSIEFALSLAALGLVYVGSGTFSIWKPEDAIIHRRPGDEGAQ